MNQNQPYEEVTVPAGANQKKKTLADVQELAQWVYDKGEQESTYLFASLHTEMLEGTAAFSVYEPTQNPDDEETCICLHVKVDMEGDWQTFLYYMTLDELKQNFGYEEEAPIECAVPKHCLLLTLDEARAVHRNDYITYRHADDVVSKYEVGRPTPLLGTPYYVVAQHMGRDNALRLLVITLDVMRDVYSL